MLPFFELSGKVPKFSQSRNILRSGFMIDGQLSFNIITETPSTHQSKDWITFGHCQTVHPSPLTPTHLVG